MTKALFISLVIFLGLILGGILVFQNLIVIVTGFAILGTGVIFFNYRYGVFLTIFSLPFAGEYFQFFIGEMKIFPSEALLLVTFVSFLFNNLSNKRPLHFAAYYSPLIFCYLFLLLINTFIVSVSLYKSFLYLFHFVEAVTIYVIVFNMIKEEKVQTKAVLAVIVLTALFQSTVGIIQHFTGWFGADFISDRGYLGILGIGSRQVRHAVGTFGSGSFNILASFLGACLCGLLPLGITKKNKFLFLALFVIIACLIFTYSRGALSGVAGASICIVFYKFKRKIFFVYLVCLIAVAGLFAVKATYNRSYMETVSYEDREKIWELPWAVITKNPANFIFGTGTNTYEMVVQYPADVHEDQQKLWFAHNTYLLVWQETGLIGLAILLVFFLAIIIRNISCLRRSAQDLFDLRVGMLAITVLAVIHGYFDHSFHLIQFRNLFFVYLALTETYG